MKNIIVSALVALVVGSFAGGVVAKQLAPAPVSQSLGATGDTVTNLQTFANDLRISGKESQGTTTLAVLSALTTTGSCITMNATSSSQKVHTVFVATTTIPGMSGFIGYAFGACKSSGF